MRFGLIAAAALACAPVAAAAQDVGGNDYPTEARAEYVFACMAANGQNQDMLGAAPARSTSSPRSCPTSATSRPRRC